MTKRIDQCDSEEEVAEIRRYAAENYRANRDRRLAQSKESQRRRWAENAELIRDRNRQWRNDHRAEFNAYYVSYYYRNREAILAKAKERYYRKRYSITPE